MSVSQIAVIGAGLAGLTVALRLHQKGCDVHVYEARQRVGGRVFTARMKNATGDYSTAEIGGQGISDGGKSDCLLKLASELGLSIETRFVSNLFTICTGGDYLALKDLLALQNLTDEKIGQASIGCKSMAELLDKLFTDNELLKMVFTTRLTGYEGLSTQDQSIYHNIDTLKSMVSGRMYTSTDSGDWIHNSIRGGNAQLPLKMATMLGDRIKLQKVLARVSHENQRIKLSFADGSTSYCDKLILALPAPVYSSIEFDSVVIDQHRLQTIQSVQYGANQKVLVPTRSAAVVFDGSDLFQSSTAAGNLYVGSVLESSCTQKYTPVLRSEPPSNSIAAASFERGLMFTDRLVSFFNITSDVMIMYFLNPDGISCFDEQLHILQKGYGNVGVSNQALALAEDKQFAKYDSALTHCWLTDPYSKGSFSGYNVGLSSLLDDRVSYKGVVMKEIFQPIGDRVFFVGEHATILNEVGTMEAAVESGERIAKLF